MVQNPLVLAIPAVMLVTTAAILAPAQHQSIGRELSDAEMAEVVGGICFVHSYFSACFASCGNGPLFGVCKSSLAYETTGPSEQCDGFFCISCDTTSVPGDC